MISVFTRKTLKNLHSFRFCQTKDKNSFNNSNKETIAYQDIANLLRIDSVRSVNVTKSGHPTSCASIAEIMSVLFFNKAGLKFHASNTKHFLNDRLVLSKGHAAPILYSALYRAKVMPQSVFLTLRKKDSILQGHPTPKIPFVDVTTGSLGQGLSVAAGMSYSSKYFDKINNRIYCITGDGQMAEGNIWQAIDFASHYKLNNLTLFVDMNSLGQSQQTMHGRNAEVFKKRFEAFGWYSIIIDGHSIPELVSALQKSKKQLGKPTAIICKTVKGKNLGKQIQNKAQWHGKDLGDKKNSTIDYLKSLIINQNINFETFNPEGQQPKYEIKKIKIAPQYQKGKKISTRKAYGNALKKARQCNQNVVSLDGDTRNSTFSCTLLQKFPNSFVQCFIAEQNMIGVAVGLACRNKIPFCSSFGAFLMRAADQIRVAGIGGNPIRIVGSHAGCSIGEDGPSQMALEDLGFYRSIPKGVVLVPSDGVSTQKAVQLVSNYNEGPSYIRTSRPDVPILYSNEQDFSLGRSKVLYKSSNDKIAIFAHGVMVHECVKAYQKLSERGIKIRIIDIFSLKPLDETTIKTSITQCGGKCMVVEEHYQAGGAFDAICATAPSQIDKISHLCVRKVPGSASPQQQLAIQGLNYQNIVLEVQNILKLTS